MENNSFNWKRFLPLIILIIAISVAYYYKIGDYFTFEKLKENRYSLIGRIQLHPLLSPLCFMALYFVAVTMSLPGAAFLTILSGFLFKQPWSTLYVVLAATAGATTIFLIAKSSLGDYLRQKAGSRLDKIEQGLKENQASYLLFLRLVPIFPFFLVNLAPAFFGVPIITFIWTTLVGIIPGSFVFAQMGGGLGEALDSAEQFSIVKLFNWKLKLALIGLGIIALLPIIFKKFKNSPPS